MDDNSSANVDNQCIISEVLELKVLLVYTLAQLALQHSYANHIGCRNLVSASVSVNQSVGNYNCCA